MADIEVNETNLIKRKDYGVRVARPYYNALNCAENQLLFNSSWPILQMVGVYKEELLSEEGSVPSTAVLTNTYTEDYTSYCASDAKFVYTKVITKTYLVVTTYTTVRQIYGVRHTLGYPPLAFKSDTMSGLSGYVILTNIDISTDVDYPYTEAPLSYFGGTADYGIKTRAYYRRAMPKNGEQTGCGINTRLSSKMVQAVKTTKTAVEENGIKNIRWRPPTDDYGKEIFGIRDFEYFGFIKYTQNNQYYYGKDIYTPRRVIFAPVLDPGNETTAIIDPGQSTAGIEQASMVILRSPMVSPEIVEVNYSGQ